MDRLASILIKLFLSTNLSVRLAGAGTVFFMSLCPLGITKLLEVTKLRSFSCSGSQLGISR